MSERLGRFAASIIGVFSSALPWIVFKSTMINISLADLLEMYEGIGVLFDVGYTYEVIMLFGLGCVLLWWHRLGGIMQLTGCFLFVSQFWPFLFKDGEIFVDAYLGFGFYMGIFAGLLGTFIGIRNPFAMTGFVRKEKIDLKDWM